MSNMDTLVSVIVPVYNTARFLEKCVKSILAQSYTNLEVILVDDGSSDGSSDICDMLSKEDERIVVIHQENQGSGRARNNGLKHVKGQKIAFVDSDDIISERMIEEMLKPFEDNYVSMSVVDLEFVDEDFIYNHSRSVVSIDSIDSAGLVNDMLKGKAAVSVVNKMYDRSFIENNKISFQEQYRFWEDLDFNIKYLENNMGKLVHISGEKYYARMRSGSQTRQKDCYKDYELVRSTKRIYEIVTGSKVLNFLVKNSASELYANVLITFYYHGGIIPGLEKKESRRYIVKEVKKMDCKLSKKKSIQFLGIRYIPMLIDVVFLH